MTSIRVLHLDDDFLVLDRFRYALASECAGFSFELESFPNIIAFQDRLRKQPSAEVAVLDINLNDVPQGREMIRKVRTLMPECAVIMCSSFADYRTIADCLKQGADDFIAKDSDDGELSFRIINAFQLAQRKRGIERSDDNGLTQKVLVHGSSMRAVAQRVPLIINSAVTAVHVFGESGTGKEVVADLFEKSLPKSTPFVRVNCGSISPTLLESELFGHVKGAFTGAQADKKGLIESADGGWIFLDEIATLNPSAQIALLRVLENHAVRRVGANEEKAIKVRVISATNENLQKLSQEGKFRTDLWQRLCETGIELLPLRQRADEIPELVNHFCKTMQGGPYRIAPAALDVLIAYSWRFGNIRELRNCLRAMTEFAVDKLLTPLSIPQRVWAELGSDSKETPESESDTSVATEMTPAQTQGAHEVTLRWSADAPVEFQKLTELLMVELIKMGFAEEGKMSLRSLGRRIGIPKSTLSTRLKDLVYKGYLTKEQLVAMVTVTDRSGE